MMNLKVEFNRYRSRVMTSDIGHRMASGAFWSFFGTGMAKAIVLLASIICARILTKEEYGQFGIVRSTIYMFVVLGSAGLGVTATKHIAQYLKSERERVAVIYKITNGFAFVTGFIVTTIILIFSPYLATNTLNSPELETPIRVGAVLLFATVINAAQNGTLTGFEDFRAVAINTFWGSLSESIFMLIGAYYGAVTGAILGYGTGYFVLYILNNIAIRKNLHKYGIVVRNQPVNRSDISILYKFSLPALISSLMVTPTYWVLRTMLVRDSGFAELAVFEAADQWRIIIFFIPSAVSTVALPILSSLYSNNAGQYKRVLKINIMLNAGIAFFAAVVVTLCSQFIMSAYGTSYINNTTTLVILAFSTVFQTMANVVGLSIYSRSKVWHGLCFNVVWALMMISFTYVFLSMGLGSVALSMAILLSYIIHTLAQLIYINYNIRHSFIQS